MFLIADELLDNTITQSLEAIRNDITVLDRVFSEAKSSTREQLKRYLLDNKVHVTKGYPLDPSHLPAFVILLGEEREETAAIGNAIGDDVEYTRTTTKTETVTIKQLGDLIGFQLNQRPVQDIEDINYKGQDVTENGFIIDEKQGTIAFGTIEDVGHEVTVTYEAVTKGVEEYGTFMISQYRIESWSNNGDLTSLMYHLIKWIMLLNRDELGQKGLRRGSIGGTDFEPVQLQLPETIYRRALTLEVSSEARWEKDVNFISKFVDESDFKV